MKKNRKVSVAQEELLVFACTTDETTKNKRRTASSLNCMPQSAKIRSFWDNKNNGKSQREVLLERDGG